MNPFNQAAIPPKLAIFTDFDGTLVEIAETPDAVDVPDDLADYLVQTAASFDNALAVITGRVITDIDRFLAPATLPVAGSHGAQRRRADGTYEAPSTEVILGAERIAAALEPLVAGNPELLLERKDGTVTVHYRQAPHLERLCETAMRDAVADVEGFVVARGKMVFEARRADIDKGEALRAFMQEEPFAGRLPVFIGDDISDEDGFVAAQELGGVGIKIGPGDTNARLRAADVTAVRTLLHGLVDMVAAKTIDQQH